MHGYTFKHQVYSQRRVSQANIFSDAIHKSSRESQKKLLQSLWYSKLNTHYESVTEAIIGTCDWFYNASKLHKWPQPDDSNPSPRLFWIKGTARAGKSTLMKYMYDQERRDRGNINVLSVFFKARGSMLERSISAMYRSLLYQMLCSSPGLDIRRSHLRSNYRMEKGSYWLEEDERQDHFTLASRLLQGS